MWHIENVLITKITLKKTQADRFDGCSLLERETIFPTDTVIMRIFMNTGIKNVMPIMLKGIQICEFIRCPQDYRLKSW